MQSHEQSKIVIKSDNQTMHNDDPIFKPIIAASIHLRNWIFATMKPVEIGSKLVFYGSVIFFGEQVGSAPKNYKCIIRKITWF